MKLGYDAKRIFNNHTGLGNYSRTLLDNLCQYAPENEYLLFSPKIGKGELTTSYSTKFQTIQSNSKLGGTYWRSFGIKKDIAKSGIEVYHGLTNELPFGLKNVKKVVTIHDLIFKVLPDTYPRMDRLIYDFKSKNACKEADVVIAISECTKRDIIRFYGINEKKIKVLYQACNSIFYKKLEKPDYNLLKRHNIPKDFILSVGSVVERKNLLFLVKTLKEMPKDLRIPLVVVGNGKKYRKEIQEYIFKNDLEKWVIWIENLHSNQDLKQLYQMSKMLVYPSRYEGFGLPVVEGMLCETPVITSNRSSLMEAGKEGALLVDLNDIGQLRDQMCSVLTNENLRKKMIKEGSEFARTKFSGETLSRELLEVYYDGGV